MMKKDNLEVNVFATAEEMGIASARDVSCAICAMLEKKEEINMIFAAAPSQNTFLKSLIADDKIEWSRINAFHMDEYVGIDKTAPQSFANFLREKLFNLVPFKSVNCLNCAAASVEEECDRYTKLLDENPVDIVCLGIGENGHIAFNDPPVADFNDKKAVKIVELDCVCRQQQVNDKCFATIEDVPTHAMTLTIPALMRAEAMFCMVPYATKANAVKETLEGEISTKCPASILRTKVGAHLYLDAESSSKIATARARLDKGEA